MTQLLSIAMLLTLLAPQQQNLPDAYYELPEQVREQATLIVKGIYAEGRSPCFFMPDGTRRWTLQSFVQVKKVYRGEVRSKFLYLNRNALAETKAHSMKLTRGQTYLLLLRPSPESMKVIQGEYVPGWDALTDEEILAIVELK
jgi:hypothetical protein